MTERDLTRLAAKLEAAYLGGSNPETDVDHDDDWLDVARECVRQMEWARRKCVSSEMADRDMWEGERAISLSIASDEWEPHAK